MSYLRTMAFRAGHILAIQREIEAPGTGKSEHRTLIRDINHSEVTAEKATDKPNLWYLRSSTSKGRGRVPAPAPGCEIIAREAIFAKRDEEAGVIRSIGIQYPADDHYEIVGPDRSDRWHDLDERCKRGVGIVSASKMPIWAARYMLTAKSSTVHRLHSMTEEDAVAEGWAPTLNGTALDHFREDWIERQGQENWDNNPWVIATKFEPRRIPLGTARGN